MNSEFSSILIKQDVESPSRIDRTSVGIYLSQPNKIETRERYETSILVSGYRLCPEGNLHL